MDPQTKKSNRDFEAEMHKYEVESYKSDKRRLNSDISIEMTYAMHNDLKDGLYGGVLKFTREYNRLTRNKDYSEFGIDLKQERKKMADWLMEFRKSQLERYNFFGRNLITV